MKKSAYIAALLLLPTAWAWPQNFTQSNLPIVLIQTNGQAIVDEPKITATMGIIDNGPGQINRPTDPPNNYTGKVGIELRGSSSQFAYEKKAYDLELRDDDGEDRDAPLLGMPRESDWALISPLNDKSLLRDVLAYKLAAQSMAWAPRTRFCEVLLNGEYMGVYVLLETIKRDRDRVDVARLTETDLAGDSLTGGYILKMDKLDNAPGGDWVSDYPPIEGGWQQTWFQMHYPKPADAAPEQRAYIEKHLDAFEDVMAAWQPNAPGKPAYEDWIDVDSWVNCLLVNELSKNIDAYRLSSYFYKDRDDNNPYLRMGPVWDFNISFGIGDYCEGQPVAGWVKDFNQYCGGDSWVIHFWWEKICRDSLFQQRVAARWKQLRGTTWTDERLRGCVDSLTGVVSQAQARNFQRWPVLGQYVWPNAYIGQTWQQEVDYLKSWLIQRAEWMDGNIETVGPSALPPYPFLWDARIFPNPITPGTQLTLEYSTGGLKSDPTFSLFDMTGRQVLTPQKLPKGQRARANFPLQILPNGTYFYKIESLGKVLKQGKLEVAR